MADYLPEMIEAPDPVTEEVNPNINADIEMKVTEDTTEDAFAGDEEIIRQEIEEELKEEEELQEPDETVPVVKTRKKLQQEEVFATPKVKPVLPLAEEPRSARKKRPCSEKQKAHLKRIREKANITHAKKRAEKKKKEEEQGIAPHSVPAPQPRKTQKSSGITEADVERISTEAITKYEAVRKQRKAEKKKNEAEAKHKEEIKKKINRAMRKPDPDDIWAEALGGMMN